MRDEEDTFEEAVRVCYADILNGCLQERRSKKDEKIRKMKDVDTEKKHKYGGASLDERCQRKVGKAHHE